MIRFTERQIEAFLLERKPLPADYRKRLELRQKKGHKEQSLEIKGSEGSDFQVILRQSSLNHLDFSVILAVCPRETNLSFRLRRYNGKSHEHTNRIEGTKFFDFHVHTATERYQDLGVKEDSFAEPTERFSDLSSALNCMFQECAFDVPGDDQPSLFQELE